MKKLFIVVLGLCSLFSIMAHNHITPNAIVLRSVIDLRQSPSFAAEMATQELMGTPVHIVSAENGWVSIITPDGYEAWTTTESVMPMSSEKLRQWEDGTKVIVTSHFSLLREKPCVKSAIVSDVVMGNILQYLGRVGSYYKLQLPNGQIAYLQKKNVQIYNQWLKSRQPTASNIIKEAKKFIGFPYVWGGTSIKGLDCSGLTKTCFYLNAVILPRNANQQAETGQSIDISTNLDNLQPADLLFFGSINEDKENITHVAIYIGHGEFIHSSGSVRIGNLMQDKKNYDSYNANRLLRAKRIITRINQEPGIVSIQSHHFYH